jgi:TetR/AcrR family transcriptional regulator, transcriptional repressor for nem operon
LTRGLLGIPKGELLFLTDQSTIAYAPVVSRSKSFSPATTLQQVANVFVERGYDGASLAQLEAASGLGKQSLYNAFGDKKAMYLGAVECATARWAAVQALMQSAPDGRQAVHLFFDRLGQDCASGDAQRHSCIVSAGLLEGIDDQDIQARLQAKWQGTHALLKGAVIRGQADGSIANRTKPQGLADHLMTTMSGLRVMARTQPGAARLKRVIAQAMSVLDIRN